ncbi:glutathione S-transferase family protein [Thalassospira sp. MCCC 1A03138]|uniref:glutathione S-transferase family protein n=1 Tax=Thalassospira sp. MCCC 1A03138 TaxID=1470576 RepID=UPI000A1FA73D|nr:glutathione S-transferase family protein [Thalassospira sp. MCCC 1A03138]OSQ32193.1 glutathione S-transferase [Thalassospira sp. MCCC 1A03138]
MRSDRQLTFYHAVPSRSGTVHWMLQELGIPFDVKLLDIRGGAGQTPEFLAINPLGKVPAIVHGDTVVSEAAAICCYLADAFPDAGLAPALDDPARGEYLRWLFFSPSTIEPAFVDRVRQYEAQDSSQNSYRDWNTLVAMLLDVVGKADPWLIGENFTTVDVVMGATIRFGCMFDILPKDPVFNDYIRRIDARPAYQRAQEIDAPYFAATMAG